MAKTIDYVTTMVLHDGTLGLVEPPQRKGLDRRVFKSVGDAWHWAHLDDVERNGSRARWYGYASRELPPSMRAQ